MKYCIVFILCLLLIVSCSTNKPTVKDGQIWKYVGDEDNPWSKIYGMKDSVISVRNGYVLYIDMEYVKHKYFEEFYYSSSIDRFRINREIYLDVK